MQKHFNLSWEDLRPLLQKCMKLKALKLGKQIHALICVAGIDMEMGSLNSNLLGMYAGCGEFSCSRLVFAQMKNPTVFAWNWLISASAFHGDSQAAFLFFSQMQQAGVSPNKFTFSFVLKACVGLLETNKGKELHCAITRNGFECDLTSMNALIDMYCKCGKQQLARRLFDRMVLRDVASWTSIISGYSHAGEFEHSSALFENMRSDGLKPNEFTWNAMITGYAQNGYGNKAFELFSRMKKEGLDPDLVTWNAIISGFSQCHRNFEAVDLFRDMYTRGKKPNSVTFAALLPACGSMGSLIHGRWIHGLIYRCDIKLNIFTGSALIDMYSKCGSIKDARKVFDQIAVRNAAVWNAMIGCYGKHGLVEAAVELFERMREESVCPNQVTFTCILSACSHGGVVDKGLKIFRSMIEIYKVEYTKEHYACIVDLLCRSGRIEEAYELIKDMTINVNDSIIGAFFNGCRIHERKDMAKKLAEDILKMELRRPGGFVTLSNIYAADGEWEWVENVRRIMKEKGVLKKPGHSLIHRK